MDVIIKHGVIVTPSSMFKADLAIKGEKIVALGSDLQADGAEIIEASGKYILPGALDVHTHLAMPFGGTVSSDGYFSGTRAAACGGVTTVFDYAIQRKGRGIIETVQERREMCEGEACVDYAFHCCITEITPQILDEIADSVAYGVPSFKGFMVYKKEGMMIDDSALVQLLERSKETGALLNVHAENPDLIDLRIARFLREGKTSAWYHYLSRPEFVEAEADKRAIHWAKSLNAPLYIVHLGNKEGVDEVTRAKDEGYEIYAETCPQYLHFTCDVYQRDDGRNFVCSPPMKGQASQDALWAALKRGDIDTVATDHCPFQSYEKDWGKDDFTKIPNGCMGIENLYPYMLSEANQGRISFNKVVEVCASNPARIFGCAPDKGSLNVGSDADIVIYDPEKKVTISQEKMHSDVDYTIWDGVELQGYPVMTFSRGRPIFKDGAFLGQAGWGKFVKRHGR